MRSGLSTTLLRAHWRRKAALSLGLTIAFCLPYFLLQHVVFFPVRRLPLSALDSAIAFNPQWVWVYQSVYVLISIVPWFLASVDDLNRYARGFLLQAYLGFAVFLLLPIAGPRPAAASGGAMFQLLLSYDSSLNSFPSLHVGLAVYTVFVAAALSHGRQRFDLLSSTDTKPTPKLSEANSRRFRNVLQGVGGTDDPNVCETTPLWTQSWSTECAISRCSDIHRPRIDAVSRSEV